MEKLRYAADQIAAVWKMAANDPDWRDRLDASVDGVFRSFEAALYAIPLSVALYAFTLRAAAHTDEFPTAPLVSAPAPAFIGVQTIAYAAEWAASLALLILVARTLGADRRAATLIAGYNWAQAPITAIQAATMGGIAFSGSSALGGALAIPALVLQILILWGVLRRGYERDVGVTIAILGGLILVSIVATSLVVSVGGAIFGA